MLPPRSNATLEASGDHGDVVDDLVSLYGMTAFDVNPVWPNVVDGASFRVGGGTTCSPDQNRIGTYPISLLRPCVISAVEVEVTSVVAGSSGTFAMYDSLPTGRPGPNLLFSADFTGETTGVKTMTLASPYTVAEPAMLFGGVMAKTTPPGVRGLKSTANMGTGNRGIIGDNAIRAGIYTHAASVNGVPPNPANAWYMGTNNALVNFRLIFSAVTN